MVHHIPSLNPDTAQRASRPDLLRGWLHEHVYELIHRHLLVLGQFSYLQRGLFPDCERARINESIKIKDDVSVDLPDIEDMVSSKRSQD